MTSYITITDAETDPEAPLTSELAKKWRDNPVAMFEGETGAPKFLGKAIADEVNGGLPVATVAAGNVESAIGQGFVAGTTSTTSTTDVVAAQYTIKSYTGTLRFRASHNGVSGSTSILSIYKNNVLVQSYTTSSTTAVQRTNDIAIVPTDVIEWRHRTGGAGTSLVSAISVLADNPYVRQSAFRRNSEAV